MFEWHCKQQLLSAMCVLCLCVCVQWECLRYTALAEESALFWVSWNTGAGFPRSKAEWWSLVGRSGLAQGASPGISVSGANQKLPWTNGWLSSTSAVGRHFSSTKTCRRKSRHASDTPSGRLGFVGWVAILKMAAIASYSAHGGFWVSISTTVQATLLRGNRHKALVLLLCDGFVVFQNLLLRFAVFQNDWDVLLLSCFWICSRVFGFCFSVCWHFAFAQKNSALEWRYIKKMQHYYYYLRS